LGESGPNSEVTFILNMRIEASLRSGIVQIHTILIAKHIKQTNIDTKYSAWNSSGYGYIIRIS